MTIELIYTGLLQGLILAIISFGVMIPFRLLNFADLTCDGGYPLGGAVFAVCVMFGINPGLAMFFSAAVGGILSVLTALLSIRLKVHSLLSGIIISTMAYSVNLRIMKKPNIPLFGNDLFNIDIICLIVILIILITSFILFLYTDLGLRFRSVGLNPKFAELHKISIEKYTIFGLFISGAIFGLAGSITATIQKFMDVGMGVGMVMHGLAGLMIGESILGNNTIARQLIAPVIGSIIYQQIQGLALSFGLFPTDLRFFTGSIVIIVLYMQKK